MNKKQVIRINENQLKQIVTETVKRVLNEGKKVNNKLFFSTSKSNRYSQYKDTPEGFIPKGEYIDTDDQMDNVYGKGWENMSDDEFNRSRNNDKHRQTIRHNARANDKYTYNHENGRMEFDANKGDSLAHKKPNSVLDKQEGTRTWEYFLNNYTGFTPEDFEELPYVDQIDIRNSFKHWLNHGNKPTGSWINNEWWEGYIN